MFFRIFSSAVEEWAAGVISSHPESIENTSYGLCTHLLLAKWGKTCRGETLYGSGSITRDRPTRTIRTYALYGISAIMCSSRLCAARLSRLYKTLFHQLSPNFIRLLNFT